MFAASLLLLPFGRPTYAQPVTDAPAEASSRAPDPQAARRHFETAEEHFAAKRFPEALAAYEAGWQADPRPGFLLNIAQCQRRMGDLPKARVTFQRYLLVAPDSPRRPEVEGLIAEIDDVLARARAAEEVRLAETPRAPAPAAHVTAVAQAPAPVPKSRLWWWIGAATAVAAGSAALFALSHKSSAPAPAEISEGSIGTLRR